MKPVYVDGPLLGQRFDTDTDKVAAIEYDDQFGSPFGGAHEVIYQFRQFTLHSGGKAVLLWLGYCGAEPDAEAIARALLTADALDRAEVLDAPGPPWS